jgi:hypothetical protein
MTVVVACAALGLLACGKEVGRVPFAAEGTATASMPMAAGEVAFWTDIDLEYTGDATLAYTIALSQGGAKVASATCDPLGNIPVKTGWVETNVGAAHSRRGSGKMTCSATLPAAGPTTVTATLAFGRKPATLTLKKADLAVRQ